MSEQEELKLAVFEGKQIRKTLHEEAWWFVIVDVVAVLTDSANPSGYLKDMRRRDPSLAEAFKGANCHPPCSEIVRFTQTIGEVMKSVVKFKNITHVTDLIKNRAIFLNSPFNFNDPLDSYLATLFGQRKNFFPLSIQGYMDIATELGIFCGTTPANLTSEVEKTLSLLSSRNFVSLLFQLEKTPFKNMNRELLVGLIQVLKETPELQRTFANFIDRIYYKSKSEVERLYREAKSTDEVTAMLSKNVERFIAEWKAEGIAEGKAKGIAKGKAEGIAEGLRQVASRLISEGMPTERISEITGLQEEEIKALRKSALN